MEVASARPCKIGLTLKPRPILQPFPSSMDIEWLASIQWFKDLPQCQTLVNLLPLLGAMHNSFLGCTGILFFRGTEHHWCTPSPKIAEWDNGQSLLGFNNSTSACIGQTCTLDCLQEVKRTCKNITKDSHQRFAIKFGVSYADGTQITTQMPCWMNAVLRRGSYSSSRISWWSREENLEPRETSFIQ